MEEGSLRCDANVSIRPVGQKEFGTRAELKNLNSFKFIQKAIEYEVDRQTKLLDQGDTVKQETRLYDSDRNETFLMRSKEEAHDYRYFPDPDLVPIMIDEAWVEELRKTIPELPEEKRERFVKNYKIPEYDAGVLTSSKPLADYFEQCAALFAHPKTISNWIMTDMLRLLKERESTDINDLGTDNCERCTNFQDLSHSVGYPQSIKGTRPALPNLLLGFHGVKYSIILVSDSS
jgi:aspartyl-tRNA(Asn)/glutamyl-tRNA(Gln) amidotransferase subunit B